jgi:acetyltransferase-like isoleucine patch superfamily enzyme
MTMQDLITSYRIRTRYNKKNVHTLGHCILRGHKTFFGYGVGLNNYVIIDSLNGGNIFIGDNVKIGSFTVIRSADHNVDGRSSFTSEHLIPDDIVIEDNVWIGSHVVVTSGVRIGKGAVVGAGAVVTHDVGEYCLVGGVPAVLIRRIKP